MKRMAFFLSGCLWVFAGSLVFGQDSIALKYGAMITAENLKHHLFILADDSLQGRETGMPGQKMAARYIADHFTQIGVPPALNGSYFQEFPLKKERIVDAQLSINGLELSYIEDFFFFPGFTTTSIKGDRIVFGGYGIEAPNYNDYDGRDVNGAVVLLLDGEPKNTDGSFRLSGGMKPSDWSNDWRRKRDLAKEKGAKAVLMLNSDYAMYVGRVKYFLEAPSLKIDRVNVGTDPLPMFFLSPAAFDRLLASANMKSVTDVVTRISKEKKQRKWRHSQGAVASIEIDKEQITSENVLCYIPGDDPELQHELLVITAHYDHIGYNEDEVFNGADDDGSGTVAVLELAKAFKAAKDQGNGARRSVLLMTVSGEEKGLLGSEWYTDHPVWPLENTVANLNIDMIGRKDDAHEHGDYVYLIGSDRLSDELHSISEEANAMYTQLELDYTFNEENDPNRFYYRSDHYNFAKNNIPVIFYFSGVHEDYHGAGDTPDKIMYDKMETITRLVFYTAWDILNRDKRPALKSAQ